jgi:hypothetical protein
VNSDTTGSASSVARAAINTELMPRLHSVASTLHALADGMVEIDHHAALVALEQEVSQAILFAGDARDALS